MTEADGRSPGSRSALGRRIATAVSALWLDAKKRSCVGRNVRFGRRLHIGVLTTVSSTERLTIGNDVHIGRFCTIHGTGSIGDGVLIENRVGVGIPRNNPAPEAGGALAASNGARIDIACDARIGFGSIVLSGVSIGGGAIVAAGSVVADDVAPHTVVRGNPAKTVGQRPIAAPAADIARFRRR